MKRMYSVMKAISAMLLTVMVFSACTKSTATPDNPTNPPNQFAVYTPGGVNIGSIVFTKESGGDARVALSIDKGVLAGRPAPYQPVLTSSTLPLAILQPLNPETGTSETFPVISTNKGLTVSYDALMFMRDLRLTITDAQNTVIASADVH